MMKKITFYTYTLLLSFALPQQYMNAAGKAFVAKQEKPNAQKKLQATVVSNQPATSYINENDIYMGRQAEILEILTVDKIPGDFPKYKKGNGIKEYNIIMDDYYRLHPDIIKQKYREKLGV